MFALKISDPMKLTAMNFQVENLLNNQTCNISAFLSDFHWKYYPQ